MKYTFPSFPPLTDHTQCPRSSSLSFPDPRSCIAFRVPLTRDISRLSQIVKACSQAKPLVEYFLQITLFCRPKPRVNGVFFTLERRGGYYAIERAGELSNYLILAQGKLACPPIANFRVGKIDPR